MKEQILFSWSGGKDSAIALYMLQKEKKYTIASLLTTLTKDYDRISIHGIRRELLEKQAKSLGLPLKEMFISKNKSNSEYESKLKSTLIKFRKENIHCVAFGDIFLKDLRKYREDKLSLVKMKGIFPLWKKNTKKLAKEFINLGFKSLISCVDSKILSKKFVGRKFNNSFLSDLPPNVDPCGENGEFHSFVYDGPIFKKEIPFKIGKVILRNKHFYYCDFIP